MYFILTLLSSVGYGDMFPTNSPERVYIVIFQIIGVFFFSYIMGQLHDIFVNYKSKMGIVDYSEQFNDWLVSFKRFRYDNLPYSLQIQMEIGIKFIWEHDLIGKSDILGNRDHDLIPDIIKQIMVVDYLYYDIFSH